MCGEVLGFQSRAEVVILLDQGGGDSIAEAAEEIFPLGDFSSPFPGIDAQQRFESLVG